MFGRKDEEGKKKKGCLARLFGFVIKTALVLVVLGVLYYVFIDDGTSTSSSGSEYSSTSNSDSNDGYEVELVSQQEKLAAAQEENISIDDLVDLFYSWYGYVPDDDDDYNFLSDDDYSDYDFTDYVYSDDNDFTETYGSGYSGSNYSQNTYSYSSSSDNDWDEYYNDWWSDYSNSYDYSDYYNYYGYDNDYDFDDDWDDSYSSTKPTQSTKPQSTTTQATPQKPAAPVQAPSSTSNANPNVKASEKRNRFLECAKAFLGTPYVWGGTSHSGIDCSGLVYLSAQEAGLGTLPRTAKTLYNIASPINQDDAISGDLVFFSDNSTITHVAIYIGSNSILHAVSDGSKTGVITSKLTENYWKKHYYSSGRIISDDGTVARKRRQRMKPRAVRTASRAERHARAAASRNNED